MFFSIVAVERAASIVQRGRWMHRPGLVLLAGFVPVVCAFGPAIADTRIFSVQTDRGGVTVAAIERNGQSLNEVGQSGARTFFEIDDGEATVPCSNQLAFTTSDSQRIEYIVDLCAHNWQVTLPLGAAPASGEGESAAVSELDSLTIYTDDPTVGIDEVYVDKQSMTIASRQGKAVAIELPTSGDAVKCERDLGLTLDDGRRIARTVDVCVLDGVIVVALDESGEAPTPPESDAPVTTEKPSDVPPPPPTVSAPPITPAPPTPTSPSEIEVVEGLSWVFGGDDNRAVLTYASANGDQIEFYGSCARGSKEAEVVLQRSAPEVRPGASATITFTAGTYAGTFTATGSDLNALTGTSKPELTIAADDLFWTALIREEFLVIQIGSATPYALSLTGSNRAAGPFIKDCETEEAMGAPEPGSPVAPDAGSPLVSGTAGDASCSEEAALFSQRSNIRSRLIVRNQSTRPIRLYWINFDGRRRPFMTIAPGESGTQPTFFTHPWVVADTAGRCLGIYFARNTDRQIVIGP